MNGLDLAPDLLANETIVGMALGHGADFMHFYGFAPVLFQGRRRYTSQPLIELSYTFIKRQYFDPTVMPPALAEIEQVVLGFRKILAESQ